MGFKVPLIPTHFGDFFSFSGFFCFFFFPPPQGFGVFCSLHPRGLSGPAPQEATSFAQPRVTLGLCPLPRWPQEQGGDSRVTSPTLSLPVPTWAEKPRPPRSQKIPGCFGIRGVLQVGGNDPKSSPWEQRAATAGIF